MSELVELTLCPACRSKDFSPMIAAVAPNLPQVPGKYDYDRCATCDLAFTNPRPDGATLGALYNLLPGGMEYVPGQRPTLPPRLSWSNVADPSFRKLLSALPQGDILDVGCGQGNLLQLIVESGRRGTGVDFSDSAQAAGEDRGFDIRRTDLNTFAPVPESYDGVVLRHVLEHIEDPLGLLTRLKAGLRPGGRIVIEVPNLNSISRYMFGAAWNGWDPPFHVNQFTAKSLTWLFRHAGYANPKMQTVGVVDEARRSFGRMRNREGRYDALRLGALPLYKAAGAFGLGSSLIGTATRT